MNIVKTGIYRFLPDALATRQIFLITTSNYSLSLTESHKYSNYESNSRLAAQEEKYN